MSEGISRRDLFALGTAALVRIDPALAQHVHHSVAQEKQASGTYRPKYFNEHEYRTLVRLSDLIIPADAGAPGAIAGGAPEFIDFLANGNAEVAGIYTGGIAWLDHAMGRRYGAAFIDAKPGEQTAMLDLIAYRKNDSPELGPGIKFFTWARKMVVDAFFTSKPGIAYLGYEGNGAVARFEVPQNVLDYVLKRSPV